MAVPWSVWFFFGLFHAGPIDGAGGSDRDLPGSQELVTFLDPFGPQSWAGFYRSPTETPKRSRTEDESDPG